MENINPGIGQVENNFKESGNKTAENTKFTSSKKQFADILEKGQKGHKALLKNIEQKVLFTFTRSMALVVVGILFVFLVVGIFSYFTIGKEKYISYEDVRRSLNPPNINTSNSIQDSIPEIVIPSNIERYLGDSNKAILLGWLENLDLDQKKDFIKNLGYVIKDAENNSPNQVIEYVNEYKALKLNKISNNEFEKYSNKAIKAGILIAILTMIGIIGLFSLILVLLAVERNTRFEYKRAC